MHEYNIILYAIITADNPIFIIIIVVVLSDAHCSYEADEIGR